MSASVQISRLLDLRGGLRIEGKDDQSGHLHGGDLGGHPGPLSPDEDPQPENSDAPVYDVEKGAEHDITQDETAETSRISGAPAVPSSMECGAAVVPHPEKADRVYDLPPYMGGEDAYFVEEEMGVLGVADGVGGWADEGIDPGMFSRQLMHFAAQEAREGYTDPLRILKRAHAKTTAPGSSTALIMSLVPTESGDKKLVVANLGDSGFVHLRDGQVLYESAPQQSDFNTPFQLGAPGGVAGGHQPDDAQIIELTDVRVGDTIVLGSDGLFDNLFSREIKALVMAGKEFGDNHRKSPDGLADSIARAASIAANFDQGGSPFAVEAMKHGVQYQGGKLDDITVVVAVLGEQGLKVKLD